MRYIWANTCSWYICKLILPTVLSKQIKLITSEIMQSFLFSHLLSLTMFYLHLCGLCFHKANFSCIEAIGDIFSQMSVSGLKNIFESIFIYHLNWSKLNGFQNKFGYDQITTSYMNLMYSGFSLQPFFISLSALSTHSFPASPLWASTSFCFILWSTEFDQVYLFGH